MTADEKESIKRFLGVVEGVATSLPKETQALLLDYIEVIDAILDKDKKGGE